MGERGEKRGEREGSHGREGGGRRGEREEKSGGGEVEGEMDVGRELGRERGNVRKVKRVKGEKCNNSHIRASPNFHCTLIVACQAPTCFPVTTSDRKVENLSSCFCSWSQRKPTTNTASHRDSSSTRSTWCSNTVS